MENNNTFSLNRKIKDTDERVTIVPQVGDELVFCKDEDVAVATYLRYRYEERNEYDPIDEEFLTDIFKKELVDGTLCNHIFIGGKKFGFFGRRVNFGRLMTDGQFFLYETE